MCDRGFRFGEGRYEGMYLVQYQLNLCDSCYKVNRCGFAPRLELTFTTHLNEKKIQIPGRNEKGLYPRG